MKTFAIMRMMLLMPLWLVPEAPAVFVSSQSGVKEFILIRMMVLIPLWLSLSVHEWAHAWVAHQLGDETAKLQGRLTLNPLAHIDPIGTFLLPLIGVPFGWAKPVPVEPLHFRNSVNMNKGLMLTAIAGPISNLVLAGIFLIVGYVFTQIFDVISHYDALFILLQQIIIINVVLALFNMLPVPPLDGSRVAEALLPEKFKDHWHVFIHFGPYVVIGLLVLPIFLLGYSPLGSLVNALSEFMRKLFL